MVEGEGQVYNVCDQKFHEFEIRKQNPDCYVMRKNLTEIAEQGKLVGEDARLFVDGQEVAVVYFRCGYVIHNTSALEDHEKSDLDPNQDHLPKSDLRSRSDPDLTWKYDLQIVI